MKLTIENTDRIVTINGLECRIWEGKTERGIPVILFIAQVAVHKSEDQTDFERELKAAPPLRPSEGARSFDARMVT